MINVDGVEYRNLEEQVQFLTDQYNGLDETFASKAIVDNIASVLNDQQSQIASANQQIANVNQQVQTVDGKLANYVPIVGTQTLDAKIFKTEIALQSPEGEITRLKNINNNITLTNGNGVNLLNIDEQLQIVQAFGKTLATLEDLAEGEGTKVTVGGVVQSTFNADTKADTATVSTLSQTVSTNSQNISSNTLAISGLAQNKADKTSLSGLASETWVNQQISAEASERQQADTNLQNQIDSEESTRQSQFSVLEASINSEITARQNADALKANINADNITISSWIAKLLTGEIDFGDKIIAKKLSNIMSSTTGSSWAYNNYIKFASGLIIQWGVTYPQADTGDYQSGTINFTGMPFTNANGYSYAIFLQGRRTSEVGYRNTTFTPRNAKSTKCDYMWYGQSLNQDRWKVEWLAIGY